MCSVWALRKCKGRWRARSRRARRDRNAGGAAELQVAIAKLNAAFVHAVCDHRETKAALQQRVKVLEADLVTAKQTCKDQEFHMQKVSVSAATSGEKSGSEEREVLAKLKGELGRENEGLRKRVRELEVVELGWKQVRGIFTTERMPKPGA